MLIETLQQYWFTEKEAKVYLAWVSLWSAPWGTIARHAGENRTTVYSILKELVKQGVFTMVERGWISYFAPISPEILVRKAEDKYNALKEKLPEFAVLMDKSGKKPKILYYEGIQWLKNLYDDILQYNDDIYAFLSDDDIAPELQYYLNHTFIQKRWKSNIHASVIVSNHENNKDYLQSVKKDKFTTVKMITTNFEGLRWEIVLYGTNKILFALYSPQELSGYIIESDQMYSSLKTIFTYVWQTI